MWWKTWLLVDQKKRELEQIYKSCCGSFTWGTWPYCFRLLKAVLVTVTGAYAYESTVYDQGWVSDGALPCSRYVRAVSLKGMCSLLFDGAVLCKLGLGLIDGGGFRGGDGGGADVY